MYGMCKPLFQVRAQGLVAACQVASVGFPVRVPYDDPKFSVLVTALGPQGRAALATLSRSSIQDSSSSISSSKTSRFGNVFGGDSKRSTSSNSNALVNPSDDMAALLWAFKVHSSQFRVGKTAIYFRSHADAVAIFHQLIARLQAATIDEDDENASGSTLVAKLSEAQVVQQEAKEAEEKVQDLVLNARTELVKAQDLSRSSTEAVITNNQKMVND